MRGVPSSVSKQNGPEVGPGQAPARAREGTRRDASPAEGDHGHDRLGERRREAIEIDAVGNRRRPGRRVIVPQRERRERFGIADRTPPAIERLRQTEPRRSSCCARARTPRSMCPPFQTATPRLRQVGVHDLDVRPADDVAHEPRGRHRFQRPLPARQARRSRGRSTTGRAARTRDDEVVRRAGAASDELRLALRSPRPSGSSGGAQSGPAHVISSAGWCGVRVVLAGTGCPGHSTNLPEAVRVRDEGKPSSRSACRCPPGCGASPTRGGRCSGSGTRTFSTRGLGEELVQRVLLAATSVCPNAFLGRVARACSRTAFPMYVKSRDCSPSPKISAASRRATRGGEPRMTAA